jgi:hypothetical protein
MRSPQHWQSCEQWSMSATGQYGNTSGNTGRAAVAFGTELNSLGKEGRELTAVRSQGGFLFGAHEGVSEL